MVSHMRRIQLELTDEMLKLVDDARGDVPRVAWIRRAISGRLLGLTSGEALDAMNRANMKAEEAS
jgi:hypothetical protein